ncbi:MAG: MarR family transcriptional regulator [Nocardiopsaceae bacterium]|nr:MarR family transcriptional regulator [Nocardiopsaceae bacterium]
MSTTTQAAPDPAPSVIDRTDDIGMSLAVLMRAYHLTVAAALDGIPGGWRGYQTLAAAVRGDQPTQLAMAVCVGIDRTVMTYLIDELAAAGLVERQLNPADRRQRKIVPTPAGRRACRDAQRRVREAEDRLLAGLDDGEREAFRALLRRAAPAARELLPAPAQVP